VSELYRPSHCRLSAKLLSTVMNRGCHVVNTTDPYGHILDFLDRSRYFFFRVAVKYQINVCSYPDGKCSYFHCLPHRLGHTWFVMPPLRAFSLFSKLTVGSLRFNVVFDCMLTFSWEFTFPQLKKNSFFTFKILFLPQIQ
jgi:hypothetical protein